MKEIRLTNGAYTQVDDIDYEYLSQWTWCQSAFYANRTVRDSFGNQSTLLLHKLIAERMGLKISRDVDHKDRDRLNNQRSNLRNATETQNGANQGTRKNNKSGYKGVSYYAAGLKWQAHIKYNRKSIYLGHHDKIEDAARAYDSAAKRLFGEFAVLNFPE